MSDISHIAGLIATGTHPSPFAHADIVTTTTHKSLRGPRGAMIFMKKSSETAKNKGVDIEKEINRAVFPGLQGGPHNNIIAAKARAFFEASQSEFMEYGAQIVKNAKALSDELISLGYNLVGGGTDTHLILIDLSQSGIDGLGGEKRLEDVGILANRNSIPGDTSPLKPSGIRLGTPSVTTRGLREEDMKILARLIDGGLKKDKGIQEDVKKLCEKFPAEKYL